MLKSLGGILIFFIFLAMPFLNRIFYIRFLLVTGALGLAFLGGERSFLESIGGVSEAPLKMLGVILGAFIVLGIDRNTIFVLNRFKIHIFFILFAVLSLIWCTNILYGFRTLAKHIAPFILIVLFYTSCYSKKDIYKTGGWILGGGFFIALWSIIANSLEIVKYSQYTIPYLHPSPFSFHMLALAIFALCSFYYDKRIIYFLLFIIFSTISLITLVRITIAAYFISLSVFFFLISTKKILSLSLTLVFAITIVLLITSVDAIKKRSFYRPDEVSFSELIKNPKGLLNQLDAKGRFEAWKMLMNKFFWTNPVIGSGVGSTQHFFYARGKPGVAHSSYVRTLCEFGVTGFGLFVLVFLSYFFRMYKIYKNSKDTNTKKYAISALLSICSFFILCTTDNMIDYIFQYSMYMFVFIAFSLKLFEHEKVDKH